MAGLRALPWRKVLRDAATSAKEHAVTDIAAALTYYAFLAVPAIGLVTLGLFTVLAGEDTVNSLLDRLDGVVPDEVITLLDETLTRSLENSGGGIALIVVGAAVALWTATSALGALMRGLNRIYGLEETRSYVRRRLLALLMLGWILIALGLLVGLLIAGPSLASWLGDRFDAETAVSWIWWTAQWPVLLGGLFIVFGAVLYIGPNIDRRRLRFVTPGAVVAIAIWIVASLGFGFYVSHFGSYNKAWGSLAGVIILLTWLWLSSLALLLGAEVNAAAERES